MDRTYKTYVYIPYIHIHMYIIYICTYVFIFMFISTEYLRSLASYKNEILTIFIYCSSLFCSYTFINFFTLFSLYFSHCIECIFIKSLFFIVLYNLNIIFSLYYNLYFKRFYLY